MQYQNIVISSGHGLHVPGARDLIDEVTEARRVTDRVAEILRGTGANVNVFHDNTTRPPTSTLNAINAHHNAQTRDLDVSVHFNAVAGGTRDAGIGVETLYRQGNAEMRGLASRISKAIVDASGMILRRGDGTWARNDLGFLNNTRINRAVLLEVCFVNSRTDVRLYQQNFEGICRGIAEALIGRAITAPTPAPPDPAEPCPPLTPADPAPPRTVALDILGKVQDVGGYIENGATFVRLTDFCDALGYRAEWDAERRIPVVARQDEIYGKHLASIEPELLLTCQDDIRLLQEIVHWEARGEDEKGQILVANVIFNRMNAVGHPNTLRGVIFHPGAFSPTADPRWGTAVANARTVDAVNAALTRGNADQSQGATFFHSISGIRQAEAAGREVWHERAVREGRLVHLFDHGNHRFYREA